MNLFSSTFTQIHKVQSYTFKSLARRKILPKIYRLALQITLQISLFSTPSPRTTSEQSTWLRRPMAHYRHSEQEINLILLPCNPTQPVMSPQPNAILSTTINFPEDHHQFRHSVAGQNQSGLGENVFHNAKNRKVPPFHDKNIQSHQRTFWKILLKRKIRFHIYLYL